MVYVLTAVENLKGDMSITWSFLHADTIVDDGEDNEERVLARQLQKRPRLLWVDVTCYMHCRCSSGECPLFSNAMYQPFYFNAR